MTVASPVYGGRRAHRREMIEADHALDSVVREVAFLIEAAALSPVRRQRDDRPDATSRALGPKIVGVAALVGRHLAGTRPDQVGRVLDADVGGPAEPRCTAKGGPRLGDNVRLG